MKRKAKVEKKSPPAKKIRVEKIVIPSDEDEDEVPEKKTGKPTRKAAASAVQYGFLEIFLTL